MGLTFQVGDLPPQRVTHVRNSRAHHGPLRASGVPRFRQFCSESLHLLRCDWCYRALCRFARPLDLDLSSSYPLATVIGALLSIAAIAAVTEEIAFRGYMQKPLRGDLRHCTGQYDRRDNVLDHAHLDHGITITHLPFQMSASIALGLLAYLTRSLIPAMVAHGIADILLQPAYFFHHPEFVWKALSTSPLWEGVASTFPERVLTIGRAMSPTHMFAADVFQTFAIIAWILLVSALLTVFAFVKLVSRSSAL